MKKNGKFYVLCRIECSGQVFLMYDISY